MARTKIADEMVLKDWNDVDITLKEIAENELELEKIATEMNEKVHDIKLEAEMKAKVHKDNIDRLGMYVKNFMDANKTELKGKTKVLTFGKTGFRLSTKVVIKKVANTLSALKKLNMLDCITVKESVNKEILKTYPEEKLFEVGASLQKEDTFWYETDRDKLQHV